MTPHQSMSPGSPGGSAGRGRGRGHQSMLPRGSGRRNPANDGNLFTGRSKVVARDRFGNGRGAARPSDCFISTACIEARGLSDDCLELEVLRLFRSGYVERLPEGPEVLAEYREKAPKIVAAIRAQGPEASRQTWDWVFEQIVCALALISEWRFDAAYQLYAEVCMQLEARFLPTPPNDPR
jgi:hypothetical protein